MLINSFHLHIFQNLDKACAQFADLMLVFLSQHWMDFVMGTKISSNYINLCLHSAQWTMSRMHSPVLIVLIHFVAPFGGTFENQSSFSTGLLDPKSLILIWDTGASYGLTPFWSDFIDYVKCAIPVRDVTKVNTVVGIGTTLHKFTDINGNPVYIPCVLYHLSETDVRLFSPQMYHQMHGGYSEVHSDCVRMLLKTSTIEIKIVRTFLLVLIPLFLEKQRKLWLPTCVLAYATPASTPWTFSVTMILVI